ncbi:DUF4435 domain-containing protein [Pseudomonas sp. MDMC216]|nr:MULTISPECIES: DUF4435 domain-containing protein [unclassified Pseudomonas]MDI5996156.1 DUF4435 domain-containing protein [Pseudomonas sp. MDMC216]MDI6010175.1 DUF4435 domain-containing protein [Pseudomonas sp. MDMC17]RAR35741.1 hypothetical protein DP092_10835 [Pseudomonas sp. MDMC224]
MTAAALIPVDLQLAADELLQTAIMGDLPIVIVEGLDDVRLYEAFAEQAGVQCDIVASENILAEKEGCEGVIKNIEIIESTADGFDVSRYILGIIDRDARYYRGEVPASAAIMMLDFYSIESHFISKETVRRVIESTLHAPGRLTQQIDSEAAYSAIISKLMDIYHVSLEALKKACVNGYNSEIGYSDKIRSVFLSGALPRILAKRAALDSFAQTMNISNCWDDLLLICKGKWLLDLFCDYLYDFISNLPQDCAAGKIMQCQYCSNNVSVKCLYRWRENYNSAHLRGMMLGYVDLPNFTYIRTRLQMLG